MLSNAGCYRKWWRTRDKEKEGMSVLYVLVYSIQVTFKSVSGIQTLTISCSVLNNKCTSLSSANKSLTYQWLFKQLTCVRFNAWVVLTEGANFSSHTVLTFLQLPISKIFFCACEIHSASILNAAHAHIKGITGVWNTGQCWSLACLCFCIYRSCLLVFWMLVIGDFHLTVSVLWRSDAVLLYGI